jgi:hypothetical protein
VGASLAGESLILKVQVWKVNGSKARKTNW